MYGMPPTSLILQEEVSTLLLKHAVEPVPDPQRGHGFYSRYFMVPKRDGGLRPILDLRALNECVN